MWFDKFCNQWCEFEDKGCRQTWSLKSKQTENPKLAWINTVAGRNSGDRDWLAEFAGRLASLVRARGGQCLRFTTTSRFATGLGREHPVENGFAWHPSLGVPYLPGSSVKGLVRAWVEGGWSEEAVDSSMFRRVFGSDHRKRPRPEAAQGTIGPQIGTVIFFDALPTEPVQLKADVMTPHYGDYYETGAAPGDWLSPNPIPFLTVAPNQQFQFALAPSLPMNCADVAAAASWLQAALTWLGAGAKTAVGYGRFCRNDAAEKKAASDNLQRQAAEALKARLANLSPLAGELEQACQTGQWEQRKEAFAEANLIEGWLTKLETTPDAHAIRRLGSLVNHHFPGLLSNPEKTEGKKNKPAFKDRQRQFACRLNALLNKPS